MLKGVIDRIPPYGIQRRYQMIHFLNEICTILKPAFNEDGEIIFEDFGDCFCKIKRGNGEKNIPGYYTHKAIAEMSSVVPGDLLITPQYDYLIVSVDRKDNILGLVVRQ